MSKYFLVTGMHRSGTTIMAKILENYDNVSIIREPFNPVYGLKDICCYWPNSITEISGVGVVELIDIMLSGWGRYSRRVDGDNIIKIAGRLIFGGNLGIDIYKYIVKKLLIGDDVKALIKDPFLVLMSEQLSLRGIKVVIMIRHPIAILQSVKRMEWIFDFDMLCSGILTESDKVLIKNSTSESQNIMILWAIIYRTVSLVKNLPNIMLVKHEDLCENPLGVISEVEKHIGLKRNTKVEEFIEDNFTSDTIIPDSQKLHVFKRNSSMLKDSWKNQEIEDIDVLCSLCGNALSEFYLY